MRANCFATFVNPLNDMKTVVGPSWLTGYLMKRACVQAETGHILHGAAAIDRMPTHADWGDGDNINILCVDGQPLPIAFVGKMKNHDIKHGDDQVPLLHILLDLLRNCDKDGLLTLMGRYNPARSVNLNTITAYRKLTAIAPILPTLLDGTRITVPKDMPKMDWDDLNAGDIVLMECFLQRNMMGSLWTGTFIIHRGTVVCKKPNTAF